MLNHKQFWKLKKKLFKLFALTCFFTPYSSNFLFSCLLSTTCFKFINLNENVCTCPHREWENHLWNPLLFFLIFFSTPRTLWNQVCYWMIIFTSCWFILVSVSFFSPYSGFAAENIINVLQGQRIGTLFHKDAHEWVQVKEVDAREMAVAARECSRRLQVSFLSSHLQNVWQIIDILLRC